MTIRFCKTTVKMTRSQQAAVEASEKVQKTATKILPALRQLTYSDRLKACKLITLHYRQIRGDMMETYKMIYFRKVWLWQWNSTNFTDVEHT